MKWTSNVLFDTPDLEQGLVYAIFVGGGLYFATSDNPGYRQFGTILVILTLVLIVACLVLEDLDDFAEYAITPHGGIVWRHGLDGHKPKMISNLNTRCLVYAAIIGASLLVPAMSKSDATASMWARNYAMDRLGVTPTVT